jgi:pantoate--beta-alanine ligase
MSLVKTIKELNSWLDSHDCKNKTLGFVPTMGYLHEGHLSLVKEARANNDLVAVSIFVNPIQFGPGEDYEKYPRDITRDCRLAEEAGADIIFSPDTKEIYLPGASTKVEVKGEITNKLCGASRPIHFKGVTTVVNILFSIVRPDRAYFGQKDAQQAIIIKKMVCDLHIPVEVIVCPIVRESDGLAMSSRNVYLNPEERKQALSLNRGLQKAREYLKSGADGCDQIDRLAEVIRLEIEKEPLAEIEYVQVLDENTLETIEIIRPACRALAAVAVRFGHTRLIDNTILAIEEAVS